MDSDSDFSDCEETELKKTFTAAANYVQKNSGTVKLDNNSLLEIYGYYKVATVGRNTDPKPGLFDPRGRQKWSAWSNVSHLTTEQAMEAYIELVKKLLNWTPDENTEGQGNENSSGFGRCAVSTFLKAVCEYEFKAKDTIFDWIKDKDMEKVETYIAQNGDLNAQDQAGLTPLHWAVDRGQTDIVELLLKSGANPGIPDQEGQTPLDYGVTCEHEDIITLLKQDFGASKSES